MSPPKIFWAATVFALIVISAGFVFVQVANQASALTSRITGTIVLTDSWDLTSKANTGAMVYSVSLPGETCNVKITGCIDYEINASPPALYDLIYEQGYTPDTSSRLTAIGSKPQYFNAVQRNAGGTMYYCQASAYSSVAAGNYIVMPWGCTKDPQANSSWVDCSGQSIPKYYSNLTVSYSCT